MGLYSSININLVTGWLTLSLYISFVAIKNKLLWPLAESIDAKMLFEHSWSSQEIPHKCISLLIFLVEENPLVFMATQFYKWQRNQEVARFKLSLFVWPFLSPS